MTITRLIGLAGAARTGKSTAQGILADEFGLVPLNFADPLKDALTAMLDVDFHRLDGAEKEAPLAGIGRSPRELMQTLGTEWGRHQNGSRFWIDVARRRLAMLENADDAFAGAVFSDVRFNEEAEWLRQHGGLILHLSRQDCPPVRAHASEVGIYPRTGDVSIRNDGSYSELRQQLIDAVFRSDRRAACFA